MHLDEIDHDLLAGHYGPAPATAMALLVRYGRALGARRFISVTRAHIDGCMYHGESGIDFARRFVDLGGQVRIPTTLNAAAVDCLHPELHRGEPTLPERQQILTALYTSLGCEPTLTCAPYQRSSRPAPGEQIAWAESNAIVFANSVLGARTDRYGDFTDLCAALTGRVPLAGLHLEENRWASVEVAVPALEETALSRDLYFGCIGYLLGESCGTRVPAMTGLPTDTTEDELKLLGAAAASSGSLALFHAVGVTPEADSLAQASGGQPLQKKTLTPDDLRSALRTLCPVKAGEPVAAVCLGSPHFSLAEFEALAAAVRNRRRRANVEFYVSTSREIAALVERDLRFEPLNAFGVTLVVDTCTYLAPVVTQADGVILTNSAKWAHYGPAHLSRRVGLASLAHCVSCAEEGEVTPQ